MKPTLFRTSFISTVCSLGLIAPALAAFPDVPPGHLHGTAIQSLVDAGVISGNPDGNFYPDKGVNRAELLKLLYTAVGITPDANSRNCFSDVQAGSWYEPYVCDAVARGYVNGYPDGTFKPGNPVNRVEALKMLMLVFGIATPDVAQDDDTITQFTDVAPVGWYVRYLAAAYKKGVLPIPGQRGNKFYPEWSLLRSEAAAFIYNALHPNGSSSSSSSVSSTTQTPRSSRSSSSAVTDASSEQASFPFSTTNAFTKKQSFSYLFSMTRKTDVEIETAIDDGQQGGLTCRLYLIKSSGFSDEYYLGYQEGNKCYITATLTAGDYQLQLQPTVAGTTFMVDVRSGSGDGNDGFSNAKPLKVNSSQTELLDSRDIYDWYTFKVSSETRMEVQMSNRENLDCIVYAMSDVDIYGFAGPQCNEHYSYPKGTYFVAVKRKNTLGSKQTYTITLSQ